jgi:hypothetical protein
MSFVRNNRVFRFVYRVYGASLVSDMKLTLPTGKASDVSGPTIVLERAGEDDFQLIAHDVQIDVNQSFQQAVIGGGSLYMRWKDLFEFLISAKGDRVLCRNLSSYAFEFLEAYLTNFAVSAALILQGEETLHATAVDIGGRATALLGGSGAGKSTLASFLRSKGGNIVTDDILRITFEGEEAQAQPGPNRIKLFDEPARLFLSDTSIRGRWSPVGGKLIYDLGDLPRSRAPLRLTALYHLRAPENVNDRQVVINRLSGLDLFRAIGGSTMNNALQIPARLRRHFDYVRKLTRILPVYSITYPRSFDAFAEVAENINRSTPQ